MQIKLNVGSENEGESMVARADFRALLPWSDTLLAMPGACIPIRIHLQSPGVDIVAF